MEKYQQYINGAFTDSHSGEWFNVENPYTGEIISQVPQGDTQDASDALESAKHAQAEWERKTVSERAIYLKKMAELIRANRIELAKILVAEQAKILPLAQVEIDVTAEYFDYYAGWARIYEGEIINSDRPNESMFLFRKPIGVVVGICPWNFPFFVMARKVAPTLLTGCTTVIKPSSTTPNTTFAFAKLIASIGLPKGVLNFVSGGGSTLGDALVRHPLTDMVSLTGSIEAGQEIIRASADKIMKVSLELGGKAPAIVFADADLDLAVKSVLDSRLIFSGQVCNCAERVYVHRKIYEPFIEKLTAAFKDAKIGDPMADPAPTYSSQINKTQQQKIDAMVKRAIADGCEVVTGGKILEMETGYFYEPTLLRNAKQDMEIIQKEVFGPVLPVMPFDDFDEVIALANDCEYGLTSSVFSTNINTIMHAIKELKFGETYVNREHFEAMNGFHAGWRKSGIGGADGKYGLLEYLQTQVAYIQY